MRKKIIAYVTHPLKLEIEQFVAYKKPHLLTQLIIQIVSTCCETILYAFK